ncbi:hypothetical protein PUN16_030690 [Pseudomonas aeruginosa]|uniref:hypothetical protein n=1 Tax=Pseudomonas aeruginosa TaxID=287 RepID=UPI0023AE792D|nr:hypothetical protein [Pseudomonas aeruginosa]MDE8666930.1 hypothetical protein [Pseudomonas aeruginosa]
MIMAVSAVMFQRPVVDLDRQLQSAGQGQRGADKAAAAELGLSLASLYRKLKDGPQVRQKARTAYAAQGLGPEPPGA